jgi:cytochrome c oxidase assembly protein subunit 15
MSFPHDSQQRSPGLALGFAILTAATFGLIVLGAVVRAKGAGLACPDWPLCFGEFVPVFDLRVALEWGHRVLASGVTLGLAGLTTVVVRRPGLRARVGRHLLLTWGLLLVQVVLGGLTVLRQLAPWTVTSHLLVGTTFCAALLWTARDLLSPGGAAAPGESPMPASVKILIGAAAGMLVLQIAFGGLVSSHAAGLACASFPTCDGEAWAPTFGGLVGLHVVHRFGAYTVAAVFALLAFATRGLDRVGFLARSGLRLVIVQIALGAANVVFRLPVEVTALHSATAAGLALLTTLLVREWWKSRVPLPASSESTMEAARAA